MHRLLGKGELSQFRNKGLLDVSGFHSPDSALTLCCVVLSVQLEEQALGQRIQVNLSVQIYYDEERNNNPVEDLGLKSVSDWMFCRYGGFSLGARSSQALPPGDEITDAISHIRNRFSLQAVCHLRYFMTDV